MLVLEEGRLTSSHTRPRLTHQQRQAGLDPLGLFGRLMVGRVGILRVHHLGEHSGEKNRGFWWVVSDLRGGLDADERVEVAVACL